MQNKVCTELKLSAIKLSKFYCNCDYIKDHLHFDHRLCFK